MSRSFVLAASAVGALAPAVLADTVATFADPAINGSTPLFTYNSSVGPNGSLSGSWGNNGLLLQTPGEPASPDYPNAHFTMLPVAVTAVLPGPIYQLGPGQIVFTDNSNTQQLLTISFGSALLNGSLNFGASDFSSNNVVFGGLILAPFVVSNEAFSFSFANARMPPQITLPAGSFTVTSSFSSSADLQPIPSPGAVALLGLGGLMIARRKR